jgi:hypothetical protein
MCADHGVGAQGPRNSVLITRVLATTLGHSTKSVFDPKYSEVVFFSPDLCVSKCFAVGSRVRDPDWFCGVGS